MKVIARKCPVTGRLFDDKQKYSKHLIKIRNNRQLNRYLSQGVQQGDAAFEWAAQNVSSSAQFEEWFRENWKSLALRGVGRYRWSYKSFRSISQIVIPELKSVKLEVKFDLQANNSHSCPQGGVTNWTREAHKPKGYPAWVGRLIWICDAPELTNRGVYLDSDVFRDTIVNIGSGGGNHIRHEYSVTLWAGDWPAWDRKRTWDILASS